MIINEEVQASLKKWAKAIHRVDTSNSNVVDLLEQQMVSELRKKYDRPVTIKLSTSRKGDFVIGTLTVGDVFDSLDFGFPYYEAEQPTNREARVELILIYLKDIIQRAQNE